MSLTEYDTDLARMDDDGWGCAITSTPEPPAWTVTIELTGVPDATADGALNRVSALLSGAGARTLYARAARG